MKHDEEILNQLQELYSRIEEIESECESGEEYDLERSDIMDELDSIKDKADNLADRLYEYYKCRGVMSKIMNGIANIRTELTGYDEREMMKMMYPNEDIDSEDFEDGFDIEDYYDD